MIDVFTAQSQSSASSPSYVLDKVLSIDELYASCGAPGVCSVPVACEGRQFRIQGYISQANVWDKRFDPWLPESKFLLYNASQDLNLEVRVAADAAPRVFDRLATQGALWDGAVSVTGTIVGIDLPIMTGCRRGLLVLITEANSLVVGDGGETNKTDK